MRELLHEIGIDPPAQCKCRKIMARMDEAGIAGCRGRAAEFADAMRDNQKEWEWSRRWAAWASGAAAFVTHPEFREVIDPLDPFPGLVELACRRAEKCCP
jgi:hypothetical protein